MMFEKLGEWLFEILKAFAGAMRNQKYSKPTNVVVVKPKPKLDLVIDTSHSQKWDGIVWHHSFSPDTQTRNWDGIVKYHLAYKVDYVVVGKEEFDRRRKSGEGKVFQKPWKDVGYHGGTEWIDGKVVFHWGRPLRLTGAHAGVKGVSNKFNEVYIGFCAIGKFDEELPKQEHWDFNLRLTRAFMDAFQIPKEEVIGHREVFDRLGVPRQKTCPGRAWDMNLFRQNL